MKCECGCGEEARRRFISGHNRRRYWERVSEARCSRCKVVKPAAQFYESRQRSNGLSSSCRECRKEENRIRYLTHRQDSYEQGRRWRAANPERSREHTSNWQKAHPQTRVERNRRRRVAIAGGRVEKIDIGEVYARDGGRCHICRKHVARAQATLDHLVPVSKGGDHVILNVRVAHRSCNSRRGAGRLAAQLLLT
jgi:5-methylcytosine-specific restriction endonuclease McrA